MTQRMPPSIPQLWDDLAASTTADTDAALAHALGTLAALVQAQQAYWMCTVRLGPPADPVQGWRPAAIRYLHPDPALQKNYEAHKRLVETGQIDPSLTANLAGAGSFRVNRHAAIVPPGWFASPFYQTYFAPFGISDVLYAATPLGGDIEAWIALQRLNAEPFGLAEQQALHDAARPLAWFHRRIALGHGLLLASTPLTGAERRLLGALLGDGTEAAIAAALQLAPSTVHTYATRIYRKFNVQGRAGLMALWLRR